MSDPSRSLPLLLRLAAVLALAGLAAGVASWEGAGLSARIGLLLLLAAPWLVVVWCAVTDAGEARGRRPLAWLLLLAAALLVVVTLWGGSA